MKEQIKNRCVFFNGISNEKCDWGIRYDNVKDTTEKPHKFPCLKNSVFTGSKCSWGKFPTDEEAENKADELRKSGQYMLEAYKLIKNHISNTGDKQGKVECPKCKGELGYTSASSNGHIWAKCGTCGLGWME